MHDLVVETQTRFTGEGFAAGHAHSRVDPLTGVETVQYLPDMSNKKWLTLGGDPQGTPAIFCSWCLSTYSP